MADQFYKFKKILGTGSKPDRAVGTWKGTNEKGGPKDSQANLVINPTVDTKNATPVEKDTNITQAAVNVAKGRREDLSARNLEIQRGELRGNARKRQIAGLSTTSMRLDENTGEAYDTEDVKPTPSGRVMPKRQANPKYRAADIQRQNEDLQKFTEADRARNLGDNDTTGEAAFSKSEREKGSTLRSLNGVTYDMKDYSDYLDTIPANEMSKARSPYDISDFQPAPANTSTPPDIDSRPSTIVPTKPLMSKMADTRDEEEEEPEETADETAQRIQRNVVREYEQKGKGPTKVEYGDTLSEANKKSRFTEPRQSKIVEKTVYERPEKMYVEEDPDKTLAHLNDEQYGFRGESADSLSTTMREVQPEGPAAPVTKKIKVVSPRTAAKAEKPTVNKPGNVIQPRLLDTYAASSADVNTSLAEIEDKNLRENRTNPTGTSPYDPNLTPGRDTYGKTPESSLIDAAKRETRAAELASKGKSMTTVHPAIMASAKAIAATSRFGYKKDDPYFDTTQFLSHPAIQEATIAHATGTHHDFSLLHKALGGVAPEVARRRNAWFKVADRMLRGNPEKTKGEFETLTSSVRKGKAPGNIARKIEKGMKPGITINGQTPTLAPAAPIADVKTRTRATNRRAHENTAANIMYQQQQSAKKAHEIMTFTPLNTTTMRFNEKTGEAYDSENKDEVLKNAAQSAEGTTAGIAPAFSGFVTRSNKNTPEQPAVTTPLTKAENINSTKNVPKVDDSKRRVGGGTEETDTSDIVERLKKGKRPEDVADES
jgi:hypothetical protein